MKKQIKKLSLSKKTISNLNSSEMKKQLGAGNANADTHKGCSGNCTENWCTYLCTITCNGNTCNNKCGY